MEKSLLLKESIIDLPKEFVKKVTGFPGWKLNAITKETTQLICTPNIKSIYGGIAVMIYNI